MSRFAIPLVALFVVCGVALVAALHGRAGTNDPKVETPPAAVAPSQPAQVAAETPAAPPLKPALVAEETPARPSEAEAKAEQNAAAASPVRDITFDDIKFNMKKEDPFERTMLTPKIEKLDGTRVRIRGFIRPSFQESGITQFVLVRDNQECCFGPGAFLFDCIVVEMQPGLSTDYTLRPVAVEGEFSVHEVLGPGKKHLAIYHLSGEQVK